MTDAGHALETGCHQVDRKCSLLVAQFAGLHHCAIANAEVPVAIPAAVRHRLPVLSRAVAHRCAIGAAYPLQPPLQLEPRLRRFVGWKQRKQFDQAHALALAMPGVSLAHGWFTG